MSRHGQTTHVWHRLVSTLTAIAVAIGSAGLVSFTRATSVHADSLGYPWPTDSEAPCEFAPNGGSSCANPNNPSDKYDWGVYISGVFHQYRNGYEYRNCTDYVQWKESTVGVDVPSTWGNGGQWYDNAPTSKQTTTPKAWDAAVVPGNPGHVAFIESVNSVDPNNPLNDNITVSEYNHDAQGHGDTWTGKASDRGFTKFVDFGKHPADGGSGGGSGTPPPTTTSRPAVVSRDSAHMDVFYLDTNHELVNIGWNSTSGWGIPGVIATYAYSNPAVTSRGSDSMDIFYRDGNSNLMNVGWTAANGWSGPWTRVSNGTVNGDPTVIHRTSDSMDVFYHDSHDNLVNMGWTASNGWSGPWTLVGNGSLASSPVAITRFSGQMSVFYRDASHDLMEEAWDSRGWNGPWPHVTGSADGDFSAITRTSDSVDVVYRTTGGGVAKAGWDTNGWNQQTFVGSGTVGNPTILSRDPGNMEVFWHDTQGNLVNDGFGTNGWSGPAIRSNNVGDNPVGVSRAQSNMDLFFRNNGSGNVGILTNAGWDASNGWHTGLLAATNMA